MSILCCCSFNPNPVRRRNTAQYFLYVELFICTLPFMCGGNSRTYNTFSDCAGRHSCQSKLCCEVADKFFCLVTTFKEGKENWAHRCDCERFHKHKSNWLHSPFTLLYNWMGNQINNLVTILLFFWVFWSAFEKSKATLACITCCNLRLWMQNACLLWRSASAKQCLYPFTYGVLVLRISGLMYFHCLIMQWIYSFFCLFAQSFFFAEYFAISL